MTVRTQGPVNPSEFSAARSMLEEAFHASFSIGRDAASCLAELNGNRESLVTRGGETLESLLRRAASDRQPIAEPLPDGQTVLIIPVVDHAGQDALAWGITAETSHDLLLRLARSTSVAISQQAQIRQYEEQLEDYVCQVSRDFEELVWLRSLAEQIGCTQEGDGTDQIAASVFPELRTMVQAEAIIMVTLRDEEVRS
ncbi:MAG: hypothetical protein ACF8TS_04540, partial [Maioricimonas sp. JB049]